VTFGCARGISLQLPPPWWPRAGPPAVRNSDREPRGRPPCSPTPAALFVEKNGNSIFKFIRSFYLMSKTHLELTSFGDAVLFELVTNIKRNCVKKLPSASYRQSVLHKPGICSSTESLIYLFIFICHISLGFSCVDSCGFAYACRRVGVSACRRVGVSACARVRVCACVRTLMDVNG